MVLTGRDSKVHGTLKQRSRAGQALVLLLLEEPEPPTSSSFAVALGNLHHRMTSDHDINPVALRRESHITNHPNHPNQDTSECEIGSY